MKRGQAFTTVAVAAVPLLLYTGLRPLLATVTHAKPPRAGPRVHRHVLALAFDRSGALMSVGSEGWLKAWDPRAGRETARWRLAPVDGGLMAAQFSGDGRILAGARLDGLFLVWDVPRRTVLRTFRLPDAEAFGFSVLSLANDGSTVAVAPAMGRLAVWDVPTGRLRLTLLSDATRWGRMALSPDGERLARSGRLPLELWDVATGRRELRMDRSTVDPLEIAWAADGRRIALAPNLFDQLPDALLVQVLATGDRRSEIDPAPGYGVNALAFSPDGREVAGAVIAATRLPGYSLPQARALPQVWESRTGAARFDRRVPLPFQGHTCGVTCLTWSLDGRRLASGDASGSVLIWDAGTGAPIASAQPLDEDDWRSEDLERPKHRHNRAEEE
jgi:WD40 repeat protein